MQQVNLDPKYFGSVLVLLLDLQEVDLDPEVVDGVCLLVHSLQLAQVELLHFACEEELRVFLREVVHGLDHGVPVGFAPHDLGLVESKGQLVATNAREQGELQL